MEDLFDNGIDGSLMEDDWTEQDELMQQQDEAEQAKEFIENEELNLEMHGWNNGNYECDCVNPNKCMDCLHESFKNMQKVCAWGRNDVYRYIEAEAEINLEDKLDEDPLPDEIYNLKDSWT